MGTPSAEPAPEVGDNGSLPTLVSSACTGTANTPESQPSAPRLTEDHDTGEAERKSDSPKDASLAQPTRSAPEQPDSSEDLEDLESLRDKTRSLAYGLDPAVLKRERNDGSLLKRSLQASLHIALTEERIAELEQSLHELDAAVKGLPDDFSYDKHRMEHWCRYQPVLKRCSRAEFDLHLPRGYQGPASTEERKTWPALEVLTSQTNTDRGPERLRIRYQPLVDHLATTTHEEISGHIRGDPGLVFLRPFKLFVKHAATIRNSLNELQKALQKAKEDPQPKGRTMTVAMLSTGEGIFRGKQFRYEDLILCLQLLIEFIDVDLAPVFEMRTKLSEGVLDEIEYADLWHLFQRGDYVVSDSRPGEILQVVNMVGGREPLIRVWTDTEIASGVVDGFVLDCISLVFNGQELVPRLTRLQIQKYSGLKRISSLNVYPLRFSPERDHVWATGLLHGAVYLDLVSRPFRHMMLRGTTVDEVSRQRLEAQVVIDTVLATNSVPEWRIPATPIQEADLTLCDLRETTMPNSCSHDNDYKGCCGSDCAFDDLTMDQVDRDIYVRSTGKLNPIRLENLATEDRVLLANWVHVFVLRSRQWVTVKVVDLYPVEFLNDFDQLILPDNHKKTIRALVEIHENARADDAKTPTSVGGALDLVKGKGTGLVILLHGEPGVGKTSTAECIADTTRRPLFPITCGDIGETPLEAERNLHTNFRMAQKWGCVLLLDEADVFLAKRTQMDIRQNAITSVFLRSLEYYAGILFLTTNRVGGIDPAFKSRVHVALLYQPLNLEATKKLYEVFVNRTKEEQKRAGVARFTIKRKEILKFAKQHYKRLHKLKGEGISPWNGRQIRNAFQTAIALVEHDALHSKEGDPAPALGAAQFETVAEASRQFDEYLTQATGRGEVAMAVFDKWRADPYAGVLEAKEKGKPKSKYSDVDSSEDSSDVSSDDDLEDEECDAGVTTKKQAGKGAKASQSKGEAEPQAVEPDSDDEMAQFEAFKRFQAMKKKSKIVS